MGFPVEQLDDILVPQVHVLGLADYIRTEHNTCNLLRTTWNKRNTARFTNPEKLIAIQAEEISVIGGKLFADFLMRKNERDFAARKLSQGKRGTGS